MFTAHRLHLMAGHFPPNTTWKTRVLGKAFIFLQRYPEGNGACFRGGGGYEFSIDVVSPHRLGHTTSLKACGALSTGRFFSTENTLTLISISTAAAHSTYTHWLQNTQRKTFLSQKIDWILKAEVDESGRAKGSHRGEKASSGKRRVRTGWHLRK